VLKRDLTCRLDHHVDVKHECLIGVNRRATATTVRLTHFHDRALQLRYLAVVAVDPFRCSEPLDLASIEPGEVQLEFGARHFFLRSPVDERDLLGPKPLGLCGRVDGSHAHADHGNAVAHGHAGIFLCTDVVNETDGINHALQLFAGNIQVTGHTHADADI